MVNQVHYNEHNNPAPMSSAHLLKVKPRLPKSQRTAYVFEMDQYKQLKEENKREEAAEKERKRIEKRSAQGNKSNGVAKPEKKGFFRLF